MAIIIDGKQVAENITTELTKKVSKMAEKPHLVVIQIGENTASNIYVNLKKKKAELIGIKSTVLNYSEEISQEELIKKIEELNSDNSVHAILVQLPLPKHIDEKEVIKAISPKKDVDGFTASNTGDLLNGITPHAYPCTPKGVLRLLDEYKIDIEGKHAVIVGRSNIVGKPLAIMLLNRNATVTICHSKTKNLPEVLKSADIVVGCVGKPNFIQADWLKEGVVLVDAGYNKGNVGDIDLENCKSKSSAYTPVPGGVGPMTINSLLLQTVESAEKLADRK